jgi:hypothetical protein
MERIVEPLAEHRARASPPLHSWTEPVSGPLATAEPPHLGQANIAFIFPSQYWFFHYLAVSVSCELLILTHLLSITD